MLFARVAIAACLGLGTLAGPSISRAQETYFLYDAQGRVTATMIGRWTMAPGNYVSYAYDRANNRTRRDTVSIPVRAAANELRSGEMLIPQQVIFSTDGRFMLGFGIAGDLTLYFGSTILWTNSVVNGEGMVLTMQADGNLVEKSPSLATLWSTGTGAYPGAFLRVQDDGNVVIRVGSSPIWSTNTCCH